MLAWKIGEDKIKVKVFHEGNFVESIIYSLPTSEHANSDSQESTHVTSRVDFGIAKLITATSRMELK